MIYSIISPKWKNCCVKIPYRGYEISISCKESYEGNLILIDTFLCVYKDGTDITQEFFENWILVKPTLVDLVDIKNKIDKREAPPKIKPKELKKKYKPEIVKFEEYTEEF